MRYLSIIHKSHPTVCIDMRAVDRSSIIDAIYYAEKFGSRGYLSNYKNIQQAQMRRRQDTGELLLTDIPKRIEGGELIRLLEGLLTRGKDREQRKIHPRSLANLRPRRPFTALDRPERASLLSQDQLIQAKLLRDAGLSWRGVGDRLETNHETIRSALRRWETNRPIRAENSGKKQG